MKKQLLLVLYLSFQTLAISQEIKYYINGDSISSNVVNDTLFSFSDYYPGIHKIFNFPQKRGNLAIKIMNINGRITAQTITDDYSLNSEGESSTHRIVQLLTNLKISDNELKSDQLTAYLISMGNKNEMYSKKPDLFKLMLCNSNEKYTNCEISEYEENLITYGKYPQTSLRRVGYDDLHNKSKEELSLMKNEIYARYGYNFSDKKLSDYFNQQDWYQPIFDNNAIEITELEQDNISMISVFENKVIYRKLGSTLYEYALSVNRYSLRDFKNAKSIKRSFSDGDIKMCTLTQYNKHGIEISNYDCIENKLMSENIFYSDLLIQNNNIGESAIPVYYYYTPEGRMYKVVEISYFEDMIEEITFLYDNNDNVICKKYYTNNDYSDFDYYEYDANQNLIKTYSKEEDEEDDEDEDEKFIIQYFYDENNKLINYVSLHSHSETKINYKENHFHEAESYTIVDNQKVFNYHILVKKIKKDKQGRIIYEECEGKHLNFDYISITEIEYYDN